MTRLLQVGFDFAVPVTNVIGADNPNGLSVVGSVSATTTATHTGGGCLGLGASGAAAYVALRNPVLSETGYLRGYFRIPNGNLPAAAAPIMGWVGAVGVAVRLTPTGTVQLWNNVTGTQIGSDSAAAFTTGAPYGRVELKWVTNASVQITACELQFATDGLDGAGVSVASASGLTLAVSGAPVCVGYLGTAQGFKSLFVDDVAINDSAGAVNNSWPGSGNVLPLKPAADSAVGAGWTLGTGTAISGNTGATAVKNTTPPLGVADLTAGSDTKQIRNAASNANANYDATMQTYTAAGVPAGATINAVIPWTATAAPLVTSAKLGTVGVVSNPTIANVNLGAGGTAGAFWSGVAGGSYPTGWKWSPGTLTETPTVTLGTAPVMRITQVTASTRIAVVCSMGMYVDYTPAPAVIPDTGMAMTVT